MVGNLGNLDNLLQEDGGLLQDKLEVVFEAVRDLSAAQVGQQQHVHLLDSCLAVPEQGLFLQSTDSLVKACCWKCLAFLHMGWSIATPEQGLLLLQSIYGLLKIPMQGLGCGQL